MPKEFFKAIKQSVKAASAYDKETSRRETAFDSARRDEPRVNEASPQPSKATSPQATTPTESPAVGQVLSVIGPTLVFRGMLAAEEDLLVQGRLEGSIKHSGSNLTIGANGEVKADIFARKVIIQGGVYGVVRASDAIIVEASARVHGNLFAPRISLKEGCRFKGSIDMDVARAEESASRASRNQETARD
jgi:cytoskeletal protein CcmA (bactofilin family)